MTSPSFSPQHKKGAQVKPFPSLPSSHPEQFAPPHLHALLAEEVGGGVEHVGGVAGVVVGVGGVVIGLDHLQP